MVVNPGQIVFLNMIWKVTLDFRQKIGILQKLRLHQPLIKVHFTVGKNHGKFGSGQVIVRFKALKQFFMRWQKFYIPVQHSTFCQHVDGTYVLGHQGLAAFCFNTDDLGLLIVV